MTRLKIARWRNCRATSSISPLPGMYTIIGSSFIPTGFGVNSSPLTTFVASQFPYAFSEYRAMSALVSSATASGRTDSAIAFSRGAAKTDKDTATVNTNDTKGNNFLMSPFRAKGINFCTLHPPLLKLVVRLIRIFANTMPTPIRLSFDSSRYLVLIQVFLLFAINCLFVG